MKDNRFIMKKHLLFLTLLLCFVSCKKEELTCIDDECISMQINGFIKNVCGKGASISTYTFMGETVYAFDQTNCCCDYGIYIYTADCIYLGLLSGFAGNKIINGVDFYKNAKLLKIIWQN